MIRCNKCDRGDESTEDLLKCNFCNTFFHENCLGLPPDRIACVKSSTIYPLCGECDLELRLKELENKIFQLRKDLATAMTDPPSCVALLTDEVIERLKKSRQIMVYNFPESLKQTGAERMKDDKERIIREILSFCSVDLTDVKVTRLGTYLSSPPRPLRVRLNTEQDARVILMKRVFCGTPGLQFKADRTVLQRKVYNEARAHLLTMQQMGYGNLDLKVVQGVPHIIQIQQQGESRALQRSSGEQKKE